MYPRRGGVLDVCGYMHQSRSMNFRSPRRVLGQLVLTSQVCAVRNHPDVIKDMSDRLRKLWQRHQPLSEQNVIRVHLRVVVIVYTGSKMY